MQEYQSYLNKTLESIWELKDCGRGLSKIPEEVQLKMLFL